MVSKCCGKKPVLKTYDIPERKGTADIPGWKAQKAFWFECPSCGKTSSYSYGTEKAAEEAWNKGITGKSRA